MTLRDFRDIHTHRTDAGDDCIINLPEGAPLPPAGHYSVGIHPWNTETATDADIRQIAALAADPRVVAIGETGIDMLRGADPRRQREIFVRHIEISEAAGKPLIIHAVRSLPDIMQLRKLLRPRQLWVIHGYRGNAETALQLARLGIAVSLGKKFNPAVPAALPPDMVYHESDDPPTDNPTP